jgi:hypothetical protein
VGNTKAERPKEERDALDLFETHAKAAWNNHSVTPPTDDELVTMARSFRIARFSMDEGEDNWREASRIIGSRLYGLEAAGDAPLRDLKPIIRGMIGSGASIGAALRSSRSFDCFPTSVGQMRSSCSTTCQTCCAERGIAARPFVGWADAAQS